MSKIFIILVLVFSLSGCKWFTKTEYVDTPVVVIHPERPSAIPVPKIKLESRVIDDESIITMSRQDAAKLSIWLNDVLFYMRVNNNILCFYRRDLKEESCLHVLPKRH